MNQGIDNIAMAVMYYHYPNVDDYIEAMEYDKIIGTIKHSQAKTYYDYLSRIMTVKDMEDILLRV